MSDFLLELLSEEIPARMQAKARNDLARLFAEALAAAGLSHDGITTYSTPRRLALIAKALPDATEAASEEIKGPKTAAPQQALDGFLRKTGLTQNQLEDRDGTWFAAIDRPGRATVEVLQQRLPSIILQFPWPKSMRWGADSKSTESLRWIRPLHNVLAILGNEHIEIDLSSFGLVRKDNSGEVIVTKEFTPVTSLQATLGHRFHHPGPITIGGAHDYVEKLRACHVLVDHAERETIIRNGAKAAAEGAGFSLVEDEGLVVENAGLTEWPVPLLGSFDPDYLDVPEEVIQLTARTNQKYFVMRDKGGKLAPHFVCTANIDANDGGAAIIAGNERVLAARLSDARFFWQQDVKVPLNELVPRLEHVVFHERLGSLADKAARIAGISTFLAKKYALDDEAAYFAAHMSKADLVTGMVSEFPELQGTMGKYYAQRITSDEVAQAIEEHYHPAFQGDVIPTGVGAVVGLADRMDTLVGFFMIGEVPTGSRDPYALRRAALGAVAIIEKNNFRLEFMQFAIIQVAMLHVNSAFRRLTDVSPGLEPIWEAFKEKERDKIDYDRFIRRFDETIIESGYPGKFGSSQKFEDSIQQLRSISTNLPSSITKLARFVIERLKVQQREAGVRHDLIDAVFELGSEDDIVRLLARVKALQSFVETGEGANLLAGYKRAANILKKEEGSWTPDQVRGDGDIASDEAALASALDVAGPTATAAVDAEDFTAAMSALASLRAPIDAFFDKVIVNDPDAGVRARRLNLLARFRDAVHTVADFSKIEG